MTNYKFTIPTNNFALKSKEERQAVLERVRKQRITNAKTYWEKVRLAANTEENS